ncbi:MAG: hypothetical protein AAGF12_01330 [Myxococcota bacterium]
MAKTTIIFGGALIALGLVSYFGTGMASVTALIPAFAGIPFCLLGVVALKESLRKHAIHVALLLALVGGLGSAGMGFPKLVTMITGGEVARPQAVIVQSIMGVILIVYVAMGIKSFIDARKARAAESQG